MAPNPTWSGWGSLMAPSAGKTAYTPSGNSFGPTPGTAQKSAGVIPAQASWGMQALGLGLGAGAALLSSFFGRSRSKNTQAAWSAIGENPGTYTPDPYSMFADFGGAKDVMLPQLTSVGNQSDLWGRIMQNLGYNKVMPKLSTEPLSYLVGNDQYLNVAYDFGYGPQELTDLRINDKTLAELANVQSEVQTGEDSDVPFTLVKTIGGQATFSVELKPGVNANQTLNKVGKYITVDIYYPQGMREIQTVTYQNGITGPYEIGTNVSINVWARKLGETDFTYLGPISCTENTRTAFRRSYQFTVPEGAYEVRLQRTTALDTTGVFYHTSTWERVAISTDGSPWGVVRDSSGNPIKMARWAIQAKATDEMQGAVGQASAMVKSKFRSWNGTSWDAPAITNNPAWLMLGVMQGPANYKPIPDSDIDLNSFKALAENCNILGITYNRQIDSETTPLKVLNELCVLARCKLIQPSGSKIAVMIDAPKTTVVQHFSMRNSWGFHWKASRYPTPECIKVQFINPDVGEVQDERLVYMDGKDAATARGTQDVQLIGCKDKNIAYKHGRLFMAQDVARRRVYQWYCHHEGLLCTQGDMVRMTHPMIGAGLGTGRIKSVTTNGDGDITAITLDSRMEMVAEESYTIRIRLKDGTTMAVAIQTTPGRTATLLMEDPIPAEAVVLPAAQDLVQFGSTETGREMVITNIEWTPQLTALITAVDHAPGVYSADTGPIPPFDSLIQRPHPVRVTVDTPVIQSWQSDESVLKKDYDGGLRTAIILTMRPVVDDQVRSFECQYKRPDSQIWTPIPEVSANTSQIEILGVNDGENYDIRVRARRYDQYVSDWNTAITNYTVIGKTTPPPDVPPPELDPATGSPRWYYDNQHGVNVPIDFAGFRVKMHWGYNTDWTNATIISQLQTANSLDMSKFAGGLKTIMVKAVDVAGFESANAGILIRDFGTPLPSNVVAQFDYSPEFPGEIVNGEIVDDKLQALDATQFWTGNPNSPFWTGNALAPFWNGQCSEMTYKFQYTPDREQILKPFTLALLLNILSAAYKVEYQASGTNPFWKPGVSGGESSFWSFDGSTPFWTTDPNFYPMPETGIEGFYGAVTFLITCFPHRFRSVIEQLAVIADVPDVVRRYSFVIDDPAGVRCPVVPGDFRKILYVNPAKIFDGAHPAAVTPEVADDDVSGPLIKMQDAAGGYTTGKVNVEVAGY